jgi:hypothetical protein
MSQTKIRRGHRKFFKALNNSKQVKAAGLSAGEDAMSNWNKQIKMLTEVARES